MLEIDEEYSQLLNCYKGSSGDDVFTSSITSLAGDRAVTLLRSEADIERTSPIPPDDAIDISIQLKPQEKCRLWSGSSHRFAGSLGRGQLIICDLDAEPAASCSGPLETVHFYFKRSALNALADREDRLSFGGFGAGMAIDPVMLHMAEAFKPIAVGTNCEFLAFDEYMLAIGHHLIMRYGENEDRSLRNVSALEPHLVSRACEILANASSLSADITDVAELCGLPPSTFVRAFENATGSTPARWLKQHRIERAQALLFGSKLSLAQIGHTCGFADQSHFTRCFHEATGHTPGAWRKARRF